MKDYFYIYNENKCNENRIMFGCGFAREIIRKKWNPLRYLMGAKTIKSVSPKNFYQK